VVASDPFVFPVDLFVNLIHLLIFSLLFASWAQEQPETMSPAVAQIGAGSAAKDVKRESGTARLLGSGMSFFI
jgi:hypothetical protein